MKIKKHLTMRMILMAGVLSMTISACGCSGGPSRQSANELSFSLNGIKEITISYDEERITFFENEGDELKIKEYMTEYKSSYCARVDQSGESIKISEGGKPFLKGGFTRYIEVYLPSTYRENMTVTTTDGDIDISGMELSLNVLRIDSTEGVVRLDRAEAGNIHLSTTRGTLDLGKLEGDMIRIDTTSGSVYCESLDGDVTYTTTSGSAEIRSAAGSGSYKANNSGDLNVFCTQVTGDLSFYNKNGDIRVTLPEDLEFEFEAETKNGSVSTFFQEYITVNGRTASGTVGEHPAVTVKMETKNGNIEVKNGGTDE